MLRELIFGAADLVVELLERRRRARIERDIAAGIAELGRAATTLNATIDRARRLKAESDARGQP